MPAGEAPTRPRTKDRPIARSAVTLQAPGGHAVSLVLELENVRHSERARLYAVCRSVAAQIIELLDETCSPRLCAAEVILTYDAGEDLGGLAEAVAREFARAAPRVPVRRAPTAGGRYYTLKNHGALVANSEIVAFSDSDAIPQQGWLRALMRGFDQGADMVAGTTYIEPRGVYGAAFALAWIFPLRFEGDALWRTSGFFANNVAFRRDVFLAHQFDENDPSMRSQERAVSDQLRALKRPMLKAVGARTAHPAPNGLRHFVKRALATGYDNRIGRRGAFRIYANRIAYAAGRIARHHERVGLPAWKAPAAFAVMLAFHTLSLAGYGITALRPDFLQERARV